MGTVLVDRYKVYCRRCGLDEDFLTGAGMGSMHAVDQGESVHAARAGERGCDRADLTVTILEKA